MTWNDRGAVTQASGGSQRLDIYLHIDNTSDSKLDQIIELLKTNAADKAALVKATEDLRAHTQALKDAADAAGNTGS